MKLVSAIALFFCLNAVYALTVSNVQVTYSDSLTPKGNKIWRGACTYTIDADSWVWLEFSRDNGTTYTQRWIQAVGDIGWTTAGSKTAKWMVDGDQGLTCKIRVRANSTPKTYSNADADNNKYPFPLPNDIYENIERVVSRADSFKFSTYSLPPADFYVKLSEGGQFKAGFAKSAISKDWGNPAYDLYFSAAYFESATGADKFLVIAASMEDMTTDMMHQWTDSITLWYAIPKEHIYWGWDHEHAPGRAIVYPLKVKPLLDSAIARSEPVNAGFFQFPLREGLVFHRNAYGTATGENYNTLFNCSAANTGFGGIDWIVENSDTVGLKIINATAGGARQHYYDGVTDSYVQMMFFKNNAGAYKGVFMKITGHVNSSTTTYLDSIALQLGGYVGTEGSYAKVYGGPVVLRFAGFGCDQYEALYGYDGTATIKGVVLISRAIRKALTDSLPALAFSPLTSMGLSMFYNRYGNADTSRLRVGTDSARLGVALQVVRFNDLYLTSCPSEAPMEQGVYIRARTLDKKVMYNAYANSWYMYYGWGRMYYSSCYECTKTVAPAGAMNMAQDVVRGINILETSESH